MSNKELEKGSTTEPSKIEELQLALGPLLLAKKKRPPRLLSEVSQWTGPFRLLDLPRELRDNIYFHLFCSTGHVRTFHRTPSLGTTVRTHFPCSRCRPPYHMDNHEDHAIFLTNRQVYAEALAVFLLFNQINLHPRYTRRGACHQPLAVRLRILSALQLNHVRRIIRTYNVEAWAVTECPRKDPPSIFLLSILDANAAKEHLPELIEFTATWEGFCRIWSGETSVNIFERSYEEQVRFWLIRFWHWYGSACLRPPQWLRVQCLYSWDTDYGKPVTDALVLLREELELRNRGVDVEELGRKWLEETSRVALETRRKSRRKARGTNVDE